MPIAPSFQCDQCGKKFVWKPELAGRRVRCKCGAAIAVPADAPPAVERPTSPPPPPPVAPPAPTVDELISPPPSMIRPAARPAAPPAPVVSPPTGDESAVPATDAPTRPAVLIAAGVVGILAGLASAGYYGLATYKWWQNYNDAPEGAGATYNAYNRAVVGDPQLMMGLMIVYAALAAVSAVTVVTGVGTLRDPAHRIKSVATCALVTVLLLVTEGAMRFAFQHSLAAARGGVAFDNAFIKTTLIGVGIQAIYPAAMIVLFLMTSHHRRPAVEST